MAHPLSYRARYTWVCRLSCEDCAEKSWAFGPTALGGGFCSVSMFCRAGTFSFTVLYTHPRQEPTFTSLRHLQPSTFTAFYTPILQNLLGALCAPALATHTTAWHTPIVPIVEVRYYSDTTPILLR